MITIEQLVRLWISRDPNRFTQLRTDLVSVRAGRTVDQYLRQVFIVSLGLGTIAAIIGFFFSSILLQAKTGLKPELYNVLNLNISTSSEFPLELVIGITAAILLFLTCSFLVYELALIFPSFQKMTRESLINMGLHNAVAYMYAMRSGGAEILTIIRSISEMSVVYGEVAYEFRQVVRDTDFFGYDVINALKHLVETTPSQKLGDFLQDMLSSIESGGDLGLFLQDRVKILQEEARFEQKEFLAFLGMIAEIYVTLFIAGPLFLITIMVVMGMMGASAVLELTVLAYGLLPVGSIMFIVLIDTISIKDENAVQYIRAKWLHQYADVRIYKKAGEEALFEALKRFDRMRILKRWIAKPGAGFEEKPELTCIISIPIAIVYAIIVMLHVDWSLSLERVIASFDSQLMIALLMVLIPYAFFYQRYSAKIRGIESQIPDFLDRMAGINEVGLTLSQSVAIMSRSSLGLLSYEIKHIHRDLLWGGNFGDALIRFEHRVRTAMIARVVTLITKASVMSSSIADLLRIAAADSRMTEYLKRDRLSEMFIYTAIIYLSFFVFIFVVGTVSTQFLAVLANQSKEGLSMAGPLSNIGAMPLDTVRRILFHTCLVQGFFSGLIAGLMGESSVKAGVKHSCILIIIALIAFNFLLK